jgi:hypothetical protein
MTDSTRLLALLEDYADALTHHARVVRDEFGDLERAWIGLSHSYEGTGAEEFSTLFQASAARMRAYEDDAVRLLALLRSRIDHLRDFDRPTASP